MQATGKLRNIKDQFYTKPHVAKLCIELVNQHLNGSEYLWIEPSAGSGSFLDCVEFEKIGLDIDPKSANIEKADFLTWIPPEKKCILFGNPPFGRQASTAKKFIKKGCQFAQAIAFILPRSFTKPSMNGVFDLNFHCKHTTELQRNAFILNGSDYDVPCVFQIWIKEDTERIVDSKIKEEGFSYVKENPDIVFRRVGMNAGRCSLPSDQNPQSHHFWKLDEKYRDRTSDIIDRMNSHVFPSNTTGPRSLSKTEANRVMNSVLSSL
jgi:hypothetical protein